MRTDKLKRGRQRTVMCPENDEKKMLKAMKAAADSYGGINKSAVYLNPQSSLSDVGGSIGGGTTSSGNNGNLPNF